MRDKDAQLIFESYLNFKRDVVLEADEKKWEDESSVWFWLKTFDPTGFSSWPDVVEAYYGLKQNPADVGPWAFMILQIFLALPNFGLLAWGIGGIGWAGLRAAAKAAIKAGPSSPAVYNIAEKILKYATETKWFQAILVKFGKILKEKGVMNQNMLDIYENIITSGNFAKLGAKEGSLAVATKETIGDAVKSKLGGKFGQYGQYAGRAGMSKADEVEAEFEEFKKNINKGSNKGQGPTKEAAKEGKYPVGKRVKPDQQTPDKKTEPAPAKSKSKYALENLD